MENLILFLATSLALRTPVQKFKRYIIGSSGCSSFLFSGANNLHIKYTDEGDKIYFNEHRVSGVTYGLIVVEMKELYTLQQTEIILEQYLNSVRKPFGIAHSLIMELEKQNAQISVTDYWQDNKGVDWKVKGYTNGKTIAVLYVKNMTASTVQNHDTYLNGLKFSSLSW